MAIHPQAIVDPKAEIDSSVTIGPFTTVGPKVQIGPDCVIGSFCTLEGPLSMGPGNRVYNYSAIGTDSQDAKYRGGETYLEIGAENIIREYVTINRATEEGTSTRIGNNNRLLAYIHIAHNCTLGDRNIMSNVASLAGHVVIEDDVILGGLVAVHQFCRIGRHALIGAGAKVAQDIPPYCIADGVPAHLVGINRIGLSRRGFEPQRITEIKQAYRSIFRRGRNIAHSIDTLAAKGKDLNKGERTLLDFIKSSDRGVARARKSD